MLRSTIIAITALAIATPVLAAPAHGLRANEDPIGTIIAARLSSQPTSAENSAAHAAAEAQKAVRDIYFTLAFDDRGKSANRAADAYLRLMRK